MDVILHIGAHRTGTTSLQHHLASHRGLLRDAGFTYWGPKITRGGLFRGCVASLAPVTGRQRDRAAKRLALRVETIRQEGHGSLIISDENILGPMATCLEEARLYGEAGTRVAAHARGLAACDVTIAISIRQYDAWWASALAFRLARGGPVPVTRLREFFVTQPRRWRHVIEDVARAVPEARVVVWRHEDFAARPDRLLQNWTGVTTGEPQGGPRNARPATPHLRRIMADCGIDGVPGLVGNGRYMPFAPHEVEALRAQYDDDLTWLAKGADGLAQYLDAADAGLAPDQNMHATKTCADTGRGSTDDRDDERLARTGDQRA